MKWQEWGLTSNTEACPRAPEEEGKEESQEDTVLDKEDIREVVKGGKECKIFVRNVLGSTAATGQEVKAVATTNWSNLRKSNCRSLVEMRKEEKTKQDQDLVFEVCFDLMCRKMAEKKKRNYEVERAQIKKEERFVRIEKKRL